MAKWILWSGKRGTVVASHLHSYIQPSPVNLPCGSILWRWATVSGRMVPSVSSTSSAKASRNPGCPPPSGTVKTPPAPNSRAQTPLTNLKLHHLQNLLAKTLSVWTICWTPRSPWASSSWPPWCPARPPSARPRPVHHILRDIDPPNTLLLLQLWTNNTNQHKKNNKNMETLYENNNNCHPSYRGKDWIYTTTPPPSLPNTWYLILETQPPVRISDFCTSHLSNKTLFKILFLLVVSRYETHYVSDLMNRLQGPIRGTSTAGKIMIQTLSSSKYYFCLER